MNSIAIDALCIIILFRYIISGTKEIMSEIQDFLSVFLDTVYFASCGAIGLTPEKQNVDWKKIYTTAMQQNVIALVYSALLKDRCGCPDNVFTEIETNALGWMLRNSFKEERANKILSDAFSNGIKIAIMKGSAIAECYYDPLARYSSDVDYYVDKKERKNALKFLLKYATCLEKNQGWGHYAMLSEPTLGAVELHDSLYVTGWKDNFFGKGEFMREKTKLVELTDHYEIDSTQHFLFICYHIINHLILGGITIQMCIDVGMYYRKHKKQIDFGKVYSELQKIGGLICMKTICGIIQQSGIETEMPFGTYDEQAVNDLAYEMIQGKGNILPNRQNVISIYAIRDMRIGQNYSRQYVLWYRFMHGIMGLRNYFILSPQSIKMRFPDKPLITGYFLCVKSQLTDRMKRKPDNLTRDDIERRKHLFEELNLL